MAKKNVFQILNDKVKTVFFDKPETTVNTKNGIYSKDKSQEQVLYKTTNKEDYEAKLDELRLNYYHRAKWYRAHQDINNTELVNLNYVQLMYRDVDIMDDFPEIGTALDIIMEEVCCQNSMGNILNIESSNDRVKSILEDLFYNKLNIHTMLPVITRDVVKYGNTFMLLKLDSNEGVGGWKKLPVYEVERHDVSNTAIEITSPNQTWISEDQRLQESNTVFKWLNRTGSAGITSYNNYEIAHFRLLYDGRALPYGLSYLNKARRHFRLLSQMEDLMLIYRLERSMARRVFKINVGAIDEDDVESYVASIANGFKRTNYVDPSTGQIDTRKNLLNASEDYFVPVRDPSDPTPIENLEGQSSLTSIEDVEYFQNKILTALQIPRAFIDFKEGTTGGDAKSVASVDSRFAKKVRRIQQFILLELNKIATIHLILMNLQDEVSSFSISMNNPSQSDELIELDIMSKRINIAKDAISDPGNGIPIMTTSEAMRSIFKRSDVKISNHFNEIRVERALSQELEKTSEIIKRTGIFDNADNIYGVPGAKYEDMPNPAEDSMNTESVSDSSAFSGGGSLGGSDFSGSEEEMDLGDVDDLGGEDMGGDEPSGQEQEIDLTDIKDSIEKNKNIIHQGISNILGVKEKSLLS